MPKIYLLGGENVHRRSAKQVNEQALQDAGENPNVLVLPWARASFDRKYRRRKLLTDYLTSLGAAQIEFIDYSDSAQAIAERMHSASLVYLTGGVPSVLVERLRILAIDKLLFGFGGVIVGRSAGALALCRKCAVTYRSSRKPAVLDGLGLLNLTLKTHYEPADDERLLKLSWESEVYAVPRDSALVFNDGKLSHVNSVYVFRGGERLPLS
jgi:dipeptidase E